MITQSSLLVCAEASFQWISTHVDAIAKRIEALNGTPSEMGSEIRTTFENLFATDGRDDSVWRECERTIESDPTLTSLYGEQQGLLRQELRVLLIDVGITLSNPITREEKQKLYRTEFLARVINTLFKKDPVTLNREVALWYANTYKIDAEGAALLYDGTLSGTDGTPMTLREPLSILLAHIYHNHPTNFFGPCITNRIRLLRGLIGNEIRIALSKARRQTRRTRKSDSTSESDSGTTRRKRRAPQQPTQSLQKSSHISASDCLIAATLMAGGLGATSLATYFSIIGLAPGVSLGGAATAVAAAGLASATPVLILGTVGLGAYRICKAVAKTSPQPATT